MEMAGGGWQRRDFGVPIKLLIIIIVAYRNFYQTDYDYHPDRKLQISFLKNVRFDET